jgi:hypothetical protein
VTSPSERRRTRVPLVAVPLAIYLGVTLVTPAVNGATSGPGFWEHAALTAGVAGVMAAIGPVATRIVVLLGGGRGEGRRDTD